MDAFFSLFNINLSKVLTIASTGKHILKNE